jgi:flagellar assembly factor FliW
VHSRGFQEEGVKVISSKFGELSIKKADIVFFEEGILGFEEYKEYCVVDPNDNTLILWMQSITNPEISFPIIEPEVFKPDYKALLLPIDIKALALEEPFKVKTYVILTIPANIEALSANLKAPIVINSKSNLAKQIVLQDSKLSVKQEIYKELKLAIAAKNRSSDDRNRTGVAPGNQNKAKPESKTERATARNSSNLST